VVPAIIEMPSLPACSPPPPPTLCAKMPWALAPVVVIAVFPVSMVIAPPEPVVTLQGPMAAVAW
jgi:hypothetical protein